MPEKPRLWQTTLRVARVHTQRTRTRQPFRHPTKSVPIDYSVNLVLFLPLYNFEAMDRRSVYSRSVLAPDPDASEDSRSQIQAYLREFVLEFRLDNAFIYRYELYSIARALVDLFYRDQLRENVLVKQYYCDVDVAHLISYNEELAHKLSTEPADIIPLVSSRCHVSSGELIGRSSRRLLRNAPIESSSPLRKPALYNYLNTNSSSTPPSHRYPYATSMRPTSPTSSGYLVLSLAPLRSLRRQRRYTYNAAIANIQKHWL